MTIPITMPALSPTMEEGNLAKWHVKVGDKVKPGDIIAEIETDKATMEVEAVDEGVVSKLLVAEGAQGVKVNAVIAELAGEGEARRKVAERRPKRRRRRSLLRQPSKPLRLFLPPRKPSPCHESERSERPRRPLLRRRLVNGSRLRRSRSGWRRSRAWTCWR